MTEEKEEYTIKEDTKCFKDLLKDAIMKDIDESIACSKAERRVLITAETIMSELHVIKAAVMQNNKKAPEIVKKMLNIADELTEIEDIFNTSYKGDKDV